ncbi:MAG: hypothetical protein B6U89_02165 [Desulfurococcales archaeon ex4484_58]|nr:MAG: hypothetical protein B6U89_02165 [Desulfurococcales archaeon ex4484_58]
MDEELKKKIDELLNKFEVQVKELTRRIRELMDSGEFRKAYRLWRIESRRLLRDLEDDLEALEDLFKRSSREDVEDALKYIRRRVEQIFDELFDLAEKLGVKTRSFRSMITIIPVKTIEDTVNEVISSIIRVFENIRSELEDKIEEIMGSYRSTQVVSVRIREKDLELIDQLVDAGIFKSRSEAISFFARKGIEASKEWINRAIEQAKKIKELQDSIRREIEDFKE